MALYLFLTFTLSRKSSLDALLQRFGGYMLWFSISETENNEKVSHALFNKFGHGNMIEWSLVSCLSGV